VGESLKELARILGELYRGYSEVKKTVIEPILTPIEESLRDVLTDAVYRQLTDLGEARGLSGDVDPKLLYEEILRRHVGRIRQ